jgi:protein TonB
VTDVSRVLESRRGRFGRWAGAALIVCVLHVGGAALALMYWHEEDAADEVAGAMTVDLAPQPAAVPVDSPNVAHGPERQEARLTPEASKPAIEEVQKDIPPVDPSPAPEPEVALPKPQPVEKEQPKEEEAQEAAPEKEQPQQDREELAAAPPRIEAQPQPSSAPSPGQSAALARLQANWAKTLMNRLERYKRYPAAAERRGIKGVAVVRFRVDRSGHVVSSEIMKSSGSPILDEEALAVLERASPFPVPPDQIADPFLENFLPIWFGMKPDP